MHVLVIYAHPSKGSFTASVLNEFLKGLSTANHSYDLNNIKGDRTNTAPAIEDVISGLQMRKKKWNPFLATLNYIPAILKCLLNIPALNSRKYIPVASKSALIL